MRIKVGDVVKPRITQYLGSVDSVGVILRIGYSYLGTIGHVMVLWTGDLKGVKCHMPTDLEVISECG